MLDSKDLILDFDITVVVPYYNEEKSIEFTLNQLLNQSYWPKEVIFVNSSSNDNSSLLIDKWIEKNSGSGITFKNIFKNTNTPSSSKNAGVRESRSSWIAFMDCGLRFPLNWLESHVNYAKAHSLRFVSGVGEFEGVGIVDIAAIAQTYGYKRKRITIPSSLIHKSVFDQVGLFLEDRRAGYDADWPMGVKKAGIVRGVNNEVVISYLGTSFGRSISFIFKKSILYSAPTVAMKHYRVPYYYFWGTIVFVLVSLIFPYVMIPFVLLYFLLRGYVLPIKKSASLLMFKEHPMLIVFLPLLGFVLDLGKTIGIYKGVYHYHLMNRQKIPVIKELS